MDLLSDVLSVLKLAGTLYFRTAFTQPWGVRVPPFENVSRFHYVHRGRCFVRLAGRNDAAALEQGDLAIITHGAQHTLSDPLEVTALDLDEVVERSGFEGRGALVHGGPGDGHSTQLICGHFAFDANASHVLLDALPPLIHIKDYGKVSPEWLDGTLRIIAAETTGDQLGSELIALRLSEIIFMQALRHYLEREGAEHPGLAGFADPALRKALEALHRSPQTPWTVDTLAREAGLSRTRFYERFDRLMNTTPMAYLTAWRMQLARQLLAESRLPIIEVALRTGYQAEASFSRAFKRHFGMPPAQYRRDVTG